MTYRQVPPHWKLIAQLATLFTSAGIGLYLVVIAEEADPRLSQIEQVMSGRVWGFGLLAFGVVGLIAEGLNSRDKRERLFWLVSICHVFLFGILIAFSLSAMVGVFTHDSKLWASVLLAAYLGLMNFVYVQRKPNLAAMVTKGVAPDAEPR